MVAFLSASALSFRPKGGTCCSSPRSLVFAGGWSFAAPRLVLLSLAAYPRLAPCAALFRSFGASRALVWGLRLAGSMAAYSFVDALFYPFDWLAAGSCREGRGEGG